MEDGTDLECRDTLSVEASGEKTSLLRCREFLFSFL